MYEVKIKCAMNGYIVEVGCQTLVFETQGKLIDELTRYLNNPDKVEQRYQELYGPKNVPTPPPRGDAVVDTSGPMNSDGKPTEDYRIMPQDVEETPLQAEMRRALQGEPVPEPTESISEIRVSNAPIN